jgi:RNA polymerase sigma-70 factor (ECF subfamily)
LENQEQFIEALLNKKTQRKAFEELVRNYQKPLYNLIRNIVINHDDADDVLQNTFIKVFQNLKNFKGESKLFSWIYRIATNEAISHLKSKAVKHAVNSETLNQITLNNLQSDVYFDSSEINLKLQNAIGQLPDKQKLVFKMRYFDALKYEDISDILGTSVGALKASYHLAVKKIEDYVTKY